MTWILVWVLIFNSHISSGSQEFNTQEACEVAKKQMKKAGVIRLGLGDVIECVPKGENK